MNNSSEGSAPSIQPALEIGSPDDAYEKEANSVADKVMKMSDDEEEKVQRMKDAPENIAMMEEEEEINIRKMQDVSSESDASPELESQLKSGKGNGQHLSEDTQYEMGSKMGADFSNVKVHTDTNAAEMNKEFGAKAFTYGNDIYFNSGQYNPSSDKGKHLLAHELTHTVQQGKSVKRKIQRQGGKIVDHQKATTTIVAHIYYVPKKKEVKGKTEKRLNKERFSEEDVQQMRAGLQTELTKSEFFDFGNIDSVLGPHKIKFDIQFVPTASETTASLDVQFGPEGYTLGENNSFEIHPDKVPKVNTGMKLKKTYEQEKTLPDGSTGVEKGGSSTGVLGVSDAFNSHNLAHELFHNLIHNHPNAPIDLKTMINPADQEEGHYKAGGIFVYENPNKGRKKEDLNQQNIDDALRCLPVIADIPAVSFERKR